MPTKVYRNTTEETVELQGIGEIAPGEQLSVTSEYQPPVNLANYPGVIEVTDEEVAPEPQAESTAPELPEEEGVSDEQV